jgi:glycosyltransferase involved in cell wall biosynthesis
MNVVTSSAEWRGLLNIIIPVYNEGDNIGNLYREIKSKVSTPHRILIIYDFDEDNTLPSVRSLQKGDDRLVLIKNNFGRGVLNAIKSGFKSATNGPCLVVMGDLSDDLSIVDTMVEKYRQGFRVVCGSRYMRGGKQIGGPLLKRTLSRCAGLSLYYLFRIPTHDITNNFKLYDKALLDELVIESQGGFEVAMEITVKAYKKGYPICEVPTTWHDRTAGESRFRLWKWLPYYLKWYFFAIQGG